MPKLKNDTLIRALLRQPVEYTPVWLMRQAGRYLPEYNQTRARAGNFLTLCKTPSLATEVTLQPLARYKLDAAILFSDILTIPDAMGLGLHFVDGEGPKFQRPLCVESDIKKLHVPDISELNYVMNAVSEIRRALNNEVPLIGFSGSPFTLACYMIEGSGGSDFSLVKKMLYQRPDLLHHILKINTRSVADYLNAQISSGAQVVMIFDTWGGILSNDDYEEFSLAYIKEIISQLTVQSDGVRIPKIVFTKGGGQWLENIAGSGCDAIGLDWTTNIASAKKQVGKLVALQGNLDPQVLLATPEAVIRESKKIIQAFGNSPGHVFNLGHGISQFTPPENVSVLVDTVHETSRVIRKLQSAI